MALATAAGVKTTAVEASQFLARATFGPRMPDILALTQTTPAQWIDAQFAIPQTSHRGYINQITPSLAGRPGEDQFYESFWRQAVNGSDQLRQRAAYALSQIFVVSFRDDVLAINARGVAGFYDVLGKHAFGNYRQLIEEVALHPMMGLYMSHMKNQKATDSRVPDENFAREIMQLMSIGLYELNPDGSRKLSNGEPIETYTNDDVTNMARVLTGWSWGGPDRSEQRWYGAVIDPDREWRPMQSYAQFHDTSAKQLLGQSIPAGGTAESDLKAALDIIFKHPNVGPFIGRQMIQRLVTSNPSPAYVQRVAAAFNDNGHGVRGDMKAVLRAVLLDTEASNLDTTAGAGKLREPVLRLANWLRAFHAHSQSGRYQMWTMDDPLTSIGQTPLRAPSVFNFYRPDYVPPATALANTGMVSPEMQLVTQQSVVGYINVMQHLIMVGVGKNADVQPFYDNEVLLVTKPQELVDRLDLLLLNGTMSRALRKQIVAAVESITIPRANGLNDADIALMKLSRVRMAILLAMVSPEYLIQK